MSTKLRRILIWTFFGVGTIAFSVPLAFALAFVWAFDSPCPDIHTPDAIRHYEERRAQFDALSALMLEGFDDAEMFIEDESWGCSPRWSEFSIRLRQTIGGRRVDVLTGEDFDASSPEVIVGFARLGWDPQRIENFFSLLRNVDCIAVGYGRDRPISYSYRREGLAEFSFMRYDALPDAIETRARVESGVWRLDERTLLEYSSGL